MTYRALPLPAHYAPDRVGEVYRVDYQAVAERAMADAAQHRIGPAAGDTTRICLLAVDVQNTFCIPGFELYVNGAEKDNQRLLQFLYRNLAHITEVAPTLDTHTAIQIFHPQFWVRGEGEGVHPAPHTTITAADVREGTWRVNPVIAQSLGRSHEALQRHALHYVEQLERAGKFSLTIWPYHAMLGGIGHALVSAVEEAVFYHTIARGTQADFQIKGGNPLTENYSVLRPEVLDGPGGIAIGAQKNDRLIEKLLQFDAVVVAGQAKSHCVAWTIDDLLTEIVARDPALARRVYLLEDCTSPVVVPGVVDFTDTADTAFRRFAEAGMQIVRSDQPLETWPGLSLR